ncbi:alpha-E domain-containing protein [Lutibacter sp. TH_r2]|uniref:alpha-E domain-containing protein n=1 Tax=Lutibacter sp. TH_r2 TaxID=3082083 RepID=UPI0029544B60|nr:alpha-E domain-containing protein [Lutibacter sp. TH_r2]MDV7187821.1 alpha-E domain-containing protein [Lutibacter sp. TH_r2]
MLARVANNLFWMGRYIERSEHLARYLNVNYFSSLDAPNELSQSREFVLRSILFMASNKVVDSDVNLKEEDVLYNIGLNIKEPYSIIYSFNSAHENARSSRDLISTELFESLNTINHRIKNYDAKSFVKNGLYDFTSIITKSALELRSKMRATLLHDELYAVIMLGIYLERAIQVTRIINSKCSDATVEKLKYKDSQDSGHSWATLLKCVSTYDMMRRQYKKTPTQKTTLEFLILNADCPRSIKNCLDQMEKYVDTLAKHQIIKSDSAAFEIKKLNAEFKYKLIEDIEKDIEGFLSDLINKLVIIGKKLDENYFKVTTYPVIKNKSVSTTQSQ